MKTAAHTPAPWFVETYSEGLQINLECGFVVANLIGSDAPFSVANARLIAAAPALLDAAKLVIDRWTRGDLADAVRMLDAAVAQAKAGVS